MWCHKRGQGLAPRRAGARTGFALLTSTLTLHAAAQLVDPGLLRIPIDQTLFAQAHRVPPGTYRIDFSVNGQWRVRQDLRFARAEDDDAVFPCFDAPLLQTLGFDLDKLNRAAAARVQDGAALCAPLADFFADTRAHYDHGALRMAVSAAQSVLKHTPRGYVPPAQWHAGIPAASLQYHYNGWNRAVRSGSARGSQTSHYLGLRAGVNLSGWALRANATATRNPGMGWSYQSDTVAAERALPGWKSRLVLGQTASEVQVFDSIPLTGVTLASDVRMRPDGERNFAPVVRGIAQSQARVRIYQAGTLIDEATVEPGAFVIDDLSPTQARGDLLVTVAEADGSERSFTVAYTNLVELARPGVTDYRVALGRYRERYLAHEPWLVQATVRHGLNNWLTGYGGATVAQGYGAVAAGLAFNLPIGALAGDVTAARTRACCGGRPHQGTSLRARYAKALPGLDTYVALAAVRHSGPGYFAPAEAFALHGGKLWTRAGAQRKRLSASLHQTLPGRWGSVSASVNRQDYWHTHAGDTQYQFDFNTTFARASVGLALSRTRNRWLGRWENQTLLTLSFPLGEGARAANIHTTHLHTPTGQTSQMGVAGTWGEAQQVSYHVYGDRSTSHSGERALQGGGANLRWVAPQASLGISAAANRASRQLGLSAAGGVVAYGGGVVLGNALGETVAIVQAQDAARARVANRTGVRLDGAGRALVPYLQAYRYNEVRLDPRGLSPDVVLRLTSQSIAPTAGAVVLLDYPTARQYAVLLKGQRADGAPLPFAAAVHDEADRTVGNVGQGGQALVHVATTAGRLTVVWGAQAHERCTMRYAIDAEPPEGDRFRRVTAVCE